MSDWINTNRLRLSSRRIDPDYGEWFRWFPNVMTWKSRDHDKPRLETTLHIGWLWWSVDAKWRPDGKRSAAPTGEKP